MQKTRQIGFRVPIAEHDRLMVVFKRAQAKTLGYAPFTDVCRELLSLIPQKLITDEDRHFLLTGKMADKKRTA